MTKADYKKLLKELDEKNAKEELKRAGFSSAEIKSLEEKGEVVRFFGQLLRERI